MNAPPPFGPPALRHRVPETPPDTHPPRRVSAVATGTFRLGRGPHAVDVDVMLDGLVLTCVVRAGRVAGPVTRGARGVRFTDRALAAEVHRAAVEAAADALRRGWLA